MNDTAYNQAYEAKMAEYKKEYAGLTAKENYGRDEKEKRDSCQRDLSFCRTLQTA